MTHHPFDPEELDRPTPALAAVARELEEVARTERGQPPADLAARIASRIDEEPVRAGPFGLAGLFASRRSISAFVTAAAAVGVIVAAVALGQLIGQLRQLDVGSTPSPAVTEPSVSPTPPTSLSPSPTPTSTPSATPSPSPTPSPTETDDESETPEPSESEDDDDSSGRGRGGDDDGDDSSGSGSGGDDNSGPGGGG